MATLSQIVKITGTLAIGGVPAADTGKALILSATSGVFGAGELVRIYKSATALQADWAANTPARVYGSQYFAQALTPAAVRVGNLTVGPQQTVVITITQTLNNTNYGLRVNGTPVTPYTSDGTATAAEIATGLASAITALSISGLTVTTPGGNTVQLQWSSTTWGTVALKDNTSDYGPHGLNLLALSTTTADPGTSVATQLDAIKAVSNDFFVVLSPYMGTGITPVIASWCATNGKLLVVADASSAIATHVLSGATDLAATLNSASDANAALIYHPDQAEAADAAWVGGNLPKAPGTETWWGNKLTGVTAFPLTDTHITNVTAKKANCYISVGDDIGQVLPMTTYGTCADGSYIDAQRFKYALEANAQSEAVSVQLKNAQTGKTEGSDAGIQIIWGAFNKAFKAQTGAGKPLASYTIQLPTQAGRSSGDIATRTLSGLNYSADYKGAIQDVVSTGVITEG